MNAANFKDFEAAIINTFNNNMQSNDKHDEPTEALNYYFGSPSLESWLVWRNI